MSEFFGNNEGKATINWMGWGIEIPTDRLVLILLLFSIFIIFIDRVWLAFLNLPKSALRRYENKNNRKVEQKLIKAFLLASHGETISAAKEASLVAKNTKDKSLGKLLSRHLEVTNSINKNDGNNKDIAQKYFQQLTSENSTAFVGHLGLMQQAILGNYDNNIIIEEGENALKYEPKSKQILEVLFNAHALRGDIKESLVYLKKLKSFNFITNEIYKNIASNLNYLLALENVNNGNKSLAVNNLKEAIKQKPNNILASIKLSEIITGIGSKSTSIKHLEKTFFLTSHPDVLDALAKEWDDKTPGARVAKSIKLLNKKRSTDIDDDLKIEVARFVIRENIWGEAEKILSEIPEDNLTIRGFQALADIENSKNNSDRVKEYLSKAAKATEGFNYFCSSCGNKNLKWELHCSNCNGLSTIDWIKSNDSKKSNPVFYLV
ncbi:heme biosynthesis HemY N-terminal domain-containing protein [Alphaproteobacteria bacterium]|nr:heme biosynthesis HemY N-terminal domain-containing protein [Alphaproteobacteria bacterium]